MNELITDTKGDTFNFQGIKNGMAKTIPISFSVATYGFLFGVLAGQAGLSILESAMMSSFVFAGASQLVVLDLWVNPLPLIPIILTTLVINLRHILMGASLYKMLSRLSPLKAYVSVFFIVDESWAITMANIESKDFKDSFLMGSGILLFITWLGSTIAGISTGKLLPEPEKWGLDFAFIAVFIALLAGLYKSKKDIPIWLCAGIVSIVVSLLFPGKWYILAGGISGGLLGVIKNGD
ncbi:MAG: AzlC family ABC transporter permease [Deltaproteobacteria bacterium]|nr:AzlC family ABC transporter permease [Deltaproteobacteria bacterium]